MIQTIDLHTFAQAFRAHNREDQFSHEALRIIWNYIEDYEDQTGEQTELDVIFICCEYSEDTVKGIADSYSIDIEGLDDEEATEAVREYLEASTVLLGETSVGFVYFSAF